MRRVCREWRALFDAAVVRLACTAPPGPPRRLPLALPALAACEVLVCSEASLACLADHLAAGSGPTALSQLCISRSDLTALPAAVPRLGRALRALRVHYTGLSALPAAGLEALAGLEVGLGLETGNQTQGGGLPLGAFAAQPASWPRRARGA